MNKIGSPIKKEEIVEAPVNAVPAEDLLPPKEEVVEEVVEEETEEPQEEKTVEEDVLQVVNVLNGLKEDKKTLTSRVKELEKEKEDMRLKHEADIKQIKDAIKSAVYGKK